MSVYVGWLAPHTVMTTFPRACPSFRCRMASGTLRSGRVRSITGRDLAGLDELLQGGQVLAAFRRDERAQFLAYEQGQELQDIRVSRTCLGRPPSSAPPNPSPGWWGDSTSAQAVLVAVAVVVDDKDDAGSRLDHLSGHRIGVRYHHRDEHRAAAERSRRRISVIGVLECDRLALDHEQHVGDLALFSWRSRSKAPTARA
jgi:hypothetical protein